MGVPRKLTFQELTEKESEREKINELTKLVKETLLTKIECLEANVNKILTALEEEPVDSKSAITKEDSLMRKLDKLIAVVTKNKCADVEDFLELNSGGFMTFRKMCLKEIIDVKKFFGINILDANDYTSSIIVSEYAISYIDNPSDALKKLDEVFRLAEGAMTY
jgi:hypothetical protein|nr:MAG TPA: hypothetical protein [Caudoviricetes sp.]